jgi:HlyD family secretion protein
VKRFLALLLGLAGCQKAQPAPLYEKIPVEHRDIVVAASASGAIQPILTLSVKSKASGEIIAMPVQTGDDVKKGQLLAKIDPRIPRNDLTQAEAGLAVAKAQLDNATAQLKRSESLYQSQSIAETDYEAAKLSYATAQSAVVNAEASLQTAKDAMEDTQVRAPNTGTVLELDAVLGTVISSPTRDVGGGTVILKMANLDTVQVEALVDETDVGKVQPGIPVTITVDAFPNRPFDGTVLKIEPQAQVNQNVTMFPVIVNILNPSHQLKPGMNSEVEIHVGDRRNVLAVPNAALRTPRDVASAAQVLGLDLQTVQQQLAQVETPRSVARDTADAGKLHAAEATKPGAAATYTTPSGRTITLPPGVTPEEVRAAFAKRMSGAELTPAEQALLAQLRSQVQGTGGGGAGGSRQGRTANGAEGASYIVFVLRGGKIMAVPIRTGLTDQDYIEVTRGLTEQDTVLVLPSASLVQSQQQFRQRFQNVTGGGLPGVRQQQAQPANPR